MIPRHGLLQFLVLCLCCIFAGRSARAAVTQTVMATGAGVIVGEDLASAFEQAKKAALREAVEAAAGTLVTSSTQV